MRDYFVGIPCSSCRSLRLITAIAVTISLISCESHFERGRGYLSRGDKGKALEYFEAVQKDDKDYVKAQAYARELKDEIAIASADSNYESGNYSRALDLYRQVSRPSARVTFRASVCDKFREYDLIKSPRARYNWLRNLLSGYNQKVFKRYAIPGDIPINYWNGLYPSTTIGEILGPNESGNWIVGAPGAFAQIFCGPWGNRQILNWHSGYYWDGEKFVVVDRYVWTAYGGQWWDLYLLSDVEIPKRKIQVFLVTCTGYTTMTNEYGEKLRVAEIEIVAVLGHNGWNDEDLVLTAGKLTKYFEQVADKDSLGSK
jgi:hypothetical protein